MVDLSAGDTRLILSVCEECGLLRNQAAYVLATARWETAHTMKPVREAYWLSETWRKNNLRYYPWYGRGYVQLTWEENYKAADKKLLLNGRLAKNPDVALEPDVAANVLVWGMLEGWFTGKKLSDYITLKTSNFVGARRIVNGTDKAAQIAELAKQYDALLKADGYGSNTVSKPETGIPASPKPSLLSLLISFLSKLFRRST